MWSLPIILSVGAISYALCDVRSGNVLTQAICPMIFTLSLVALAVWIYLKASQSGWRDRGDSDGSADTSSTFSGFGAGDGGD